MFRFKRGVPVPYDRQGYIYFKSRLYRTLPPEEQEAIRALCQACGGEHHRALLAFLTTDAGAERVCREHYISRSTLERMVRRYYSAFDL